MQEFTRGKERVVHDFVRASGLVGADVNRDSFVLPVARRISIRQQRQHLAKLLILRKIALPRFAIRHDFVVKRCSVLTDGEPVPAVADVLTVRIFFGVGLQLVHRVLVFTGKEGGEGQSIVHIFNALALRKFTEVFFVFGGGFIVLARHEFGIAK